MDNKKITLKQTVTDKSGNQEVKTISTYTDEAILASETNMNEKISNHRFCLFKKSFQEDIIKEKRYI